MPSSSAKNRHTCLQASVRTLVMGWQMATGKTETSSVRYKIVKKHTIARCKAEVRCHQPRMM
jgi:hypothetical protein